MSDQEHRTRELAYRLWEEAGRPDGRDDDFWHAARELTAAQTAEAAELKPAAPPAPEPEPEPARAAPAPAPALKAKPVPAKASAVAVERPTAAPRRPAPKKP
jgi:hypothetical protein